MLAVIAEQSLQHGTSPGAKWLWVGVKADDQSSERHVALQWLPQLALVASLPATQDIHGMWYAYPKCEKCLLWWITLHGTITNDDTTSTCGNQVSYTHATVLWSKGVKWSINLTMYVLMFQDMHEHEHKQLIE
jgi:hypothetical protein